MKKKRKKYIKIAVEVVAFILFIAVLGYGLQYVDNKTEIPLFGLLLDHLEILFHQFRRLS